MLHLPPQSTVTKGDQSVSYAEKLRVDATSRPQQGREKQKTNYICLASLNGQGLSLKVLVSLMIFNNSVLMSVVYRRSTL